MSTSQFLPAPLRALLTVLLLVAVGFGAAPHARAADANPPERLTYQGFLADGNGNALAPSAPKNYDVVFRIWQDQSGGASALWAEQQTVTVDKGNFSVLLGEGVQITSPTTEPHSALSTIFTNATASDRYVEMTVKGIGTANSDVTILPRLRLLTAPYAFLASKVSGSGVINANNLDPAIGVWTANGANVYKSSGNVGIGTPNPNTKLQVNGIFSARSTTTTDGYVDLNLGGSTYAGYFEWFKPGPTRIAYMGYNSGGVDNLGLNLESANFMINGGNVGIGTGSTSPGEKLTIAGVPGYNSGLKLTGSGAYAGMAIENTSSGGHKYALFSSGSGSGAAGFHIYDEVGAYRLSIRDNGNVGINDYNVTQGKFVVQGTGGSSAIGYHGYLNNGSTYLGGGAFSDNIYAPVGWGGSATAAVSIYASGDVHAATFRAFSDARIKLIQGRSDSAADLKTLLGIDVTDYTYKDTVAKGGTPQKKVIGQQVETVFPQAVRKSTDVVPDIYQAATVQAGWLQLATSLKVGERVKLIGEKEENIYEVLEVRDGAFRTALKPTSGKIFVYGREVADFRTVDYEAIAMLNVSATQDLARRLEKLEVRESHLAELERKAGRVATLEQDVADLKKLVAQLAAESKSAKLAAQATTQTHAAANPVTVPKSFTTASLEH